MMLTHKKLLPADESLLYFFDIWHQYFSVEEKRLQLENRVGGAMSACSAGDWMVVEFTLTGRFTGSSQIL